MTERRDDVEQPIVAGIDGSSESYHAAAWAAVDAALHGCSLRLVISASVPPGFGPGPLLTDAESEWLRRNAQRTVDEARRLARAAVNGEALQITTEVIFDPIIPHLIARSRAARMLAVGSRGLGALRRGLLGSVGAAVTRHAWCPVAVVRAQSALDPVSAQRPVLVGVDGTPNSEPALAAAFDEASLRKVGVVALHAWSDVSSSLAPVMTAWDAARESEEAILSESLAGWSERFPDVDVRRILVQDKPARALLAESDNAQLVVVGSHGRGGFSGMLLGATSNALVASVDCPIVVVRRRPVA
ncbi:nucleotide-binding universal stress UspA family protein [Nocardia transvalensis]|uniref:Nucleotide-binding universal stress UspA family protein n=1 Tax=Nocardia transvalensis TaxID=37333 RepID=A0A7W9UKQ6_9NOCA|nr:universal stress protein [Nocardia transvalensis]MBB5916744.1 nucleotide-binding universal stress UspA family protein [Nocardia transvalensis]